MEKENLEFFEEWLTLEKYQFKILTMITILADNQRAFRGSLNQFCDELGIGRSSANKNSIKEGLYYLAENNYILWLVDKDIHTVSLAKAAEKSKNIIKIKKAWYHLIRDTRGEAAWESVLKVFLVISELSQTHTITYKEIGEGISLSSSTVGRCVKTLCTIDFKDFRLMREVEKKQDDDGNYYTVGQNYVKGIFWE